MGAATENSALPEQGTRLAVLLFTDIVGSTDLKSRLGDSAYKRLLDRQNQLFETGAREISGARVIKHTGDGFLAEFRTPSDAVKFALLFQARMNLEPWKPVKLLTRVGIHQGEVTDTVQVGQQDVIGVAVDSAARIMSLASGGQILLTQHVFNDARQYVREAPAILEPAPALRWLSHGPYLFKGVDEPINVCEVGIDGISPLAAPASGDKAKRVVPHDQEQTLGWRPAVGLEIPDRPGWLLERKLGDGGFGEVWLGVHDKLRERRVFKFCFDVDRLRSFKRELTLFRLLRDALGDRPDIARLHEVKLDEPPFFLESEYSEGGNLLEWSERNGGIAKLPLTERLELVACVADAVTAAHSVGILHKDIKPSNVLVHTQRDGRVKPRLADFGIGVLADRTQLNARGITETGFTVLTESDSSRTGTRMYAPPESLLNKPFTTKGDVYALGVLLYQMTIGDLTRPLASGWEREVSDPILRDDIAEMVEGDPERRMKSAADVAMRVRSLQSRRAAKSRQRRARLGMLLAGTVAVVGIVGGALQFFHMRSVRQEQRRTEIALKDATEQKLEAQRQTAVAEAVNQFLSGMLTSADPYSSKGARVTVVEATEAAIRELDAGSLKDQPLVEASVRTSIGNAMVNLNRFDLAEPNLRRALELYQRERPADHRDVSLAINNLAVLLHQQGKLTEAEALYRKSVEIDRRKPDNEAPLLAISIDNLAIVLDEQGRFDEAEPLFREALELRRKSLPKGHPAIATSATGLSMLLNSTGRLPEAEQLAREALDIRRVALPANHPSIAASLSILATQLHEQKKFADAEPMAREALEINLKSLPPGHPDIAASMSTLAMVLRSERKLEESEELYRSALEIRRKAKPGPQADVARTLNNLAGVLRARGKRAEAEPMYVESVDMSRKALGATHPDVALYLFNYAVLLNDMDRYADAVAPLQESLEIRGKTLGAESAWTVETAAQLARMLERTGKGADAARVRAEFGVATPATRPGG